MRLRRILLGFLIIGMAILGCVQRAPGGRLPGPFRTAPAIPSPGMRGPQSPSMPSGSPPAEGSASSADEVLSLEGPVEAIIPGGYQVAGHRVRVSPDLDAEGPLPPGVYVTVIGSRAPDGGLIAESFEVLRRPEAEGEWEGVVEEALPHGYRVDGRQVLVLPTTALIGTPQVGQYVYLSGFEQPDHTILADSLIVLESP